MVTHKILKAKDKDELSSIIKINEQDGWEVAALTYTNKEFILVLKQDKIYRDYILYDYDWNDAGKNFTKDYKDYFDEVPVRQNSIFNISN